MSGQVAALACVKALSCLSGMPQSGLPGGPVPVEYCANLTDG